jgi:hypothetical protein
VLFLSCKANARVKLASRGTDRISYIIAIVFCDVIVICCAIVFMLFLGYYVVLLLCCYCY